jgi:uncharacterized protein
MIWLIVKENIEYSNQTNTTAKDKFWMSRKMNSRIDIPEEKIAAFCRRNSIRKLAFFGSVLRNDFSPESDVDVLVEFEADTQIGLQFFKMEQELSEILGRKVDLNTAGFLSQYFRDKVIAEAEVLYYAA